MARSCAWTIRAAPGSTTCSSGGARPYLYAFDLLWLNGKDLRDLPLLKRKAMLKVLIPGSPSRLLYLDHIEDQGVELFEKCCERDLEGIVAKPKLSPYRQLRRRSGVMAPAPPGSRAPR